MNWFLGLIIVAAIIIYKRSNEIITVNPIGRSPAPSPGGSDAPPPDFRAVLGTVQQIARQQASGNQNQRGRAVIRAMVQQGKFLEAIALYQRVYGVDGAAAKRAVDEMMLEQ